MSTNEIRAQVFKAISDPTRLEIIEFLKDGEKCQCEIHPELEKSQSTISQHLKILIECGILEMRRDGQKKMYSIKELEILRMLELSDEIITKHIQTRYAGHI
ncbi:MAG: ArsR/SmtB family transcription factor [Promethearchaeota archaeon]